MLFKAMSAVVLTGALWVSGDAAYQSVWCCNGSASCCHPAHDCCVDSAQPETSASSESQSECCAVPKASRLLTAKTKASVGDCCSSGADCCAVDADCCASTPSVTTITKAPPPSQAK